MCATGPIVSIPPCPRAGWTATPISTAKFGKNGGMRRSPERHRRRRRQGRHRIRFRRHPPGAQHAGFPSPDPLGRHDRAPRTKWWSGCSPPISRMARISAISASWPTSPMSAAWTGAQIADMLESDQDLALVEREDQLAREMGVTGVPAMIFANKVAVSGAREPEVLTMVIDKALEMAAQQPSGRERFTNTGAARTRERAGRSGSAGSSALVARRRSQAKRTAATIKPRRRRPCCGRSSWRCRAPGRRDAAALRRCRSGLPSPRCRWRW